MRRLGATYIIVDGVPRQGWAMDIDSSGRIARIGPVDELGQPPADTTHLTEMALLPGQVNAHSHAFQRAIRGRTEWLAPQRPDEDFWSWREAMYAAALELTPEEIEAIARSVYEEMALCGITHVGEFHYIHHDREGSPYEDPNELAHRVIRAARAVGVRITLLRVAYHRAGFGRPRDPMQRRFVEPDIATCLGRVDALRNRWRHDEGVTIGLAPHSVRAVPFSWLEACARYAREHELPLHIHACEQRAELEQSLREYGRLPLDVFRDAGMFEANLTLVHATHLRPRDVELIARHGATVCACPTTERNLGDGFLPARALAMARVPMCVGSDSQAKVDPWEELRLIEYHERLRYERRNVLAQAYPVWFERSSPRWETARVLWPIGHEQGSRALGGHGGGALCVGASADVVGVDLGHISVRGAQAESLLSDVVFSMANGAVREVWVGGRRVAEGGRLTASIS